MSDSEYYAKQINIIDLSSMPVSEVITELEKRTLMFLPEKNIRHMHTFLTGYLCGKNCKEDHETMGAFNRFIELKYGITTVHGWARNIDHVSSDSHSALEKFFELFREFLRDEI